MKRWLCILLTLCVSCSYTQLAVCAEEDYPAAEMAVEETDPDTEAGEEDFYPDEGLISDETYRTLLSKNDVNSRDEIGGYIHNAEISMGDGFVSYTPKDEDNGLFFNPSPAVKADETKKIELRVRIPVKISEFKFYFINELGIAESRTFVLSDIEPSDEFQTIYINTASNGGWSGTVTQYRISITGAVGETFDIDHVYFWSDYNSPYTEDERGRLYDFDSKTYGFEGNQEVSDAIPYNSELWARIAGGDAAFTITDSDFEMQAEEVPRIQISYNNQTPGTLGKLYFTTDTASDYNDECCFEFEIGQGPGEYSIDTADNEQWKGKITGLRFVPSDAGGTVRIGSIYLEKFSCTVEARGGIISGGGNLYGTMGRVQVRAQNRETGGTDYSQTIRSEENGDFEFSFEIADAPQRPVEYDILFKGTAFSGTYKKRITYVSADYIERIYAEINTARIEGNASALKALIEDNYKLLHLQAEIYEAYAAAGQHMDEFYEALLGKTAADQTELEGQMNETAVLMCVKYMSGDEWLTAVDAYDDYLKLKELPAYATYESAADEVKKEIASKMSAEHCDGFTAAGEAFEKNVVLTALAHAVAWGDVKDILQTNAQLLAIDFGAVNNLKSPSEAYRQLTEKTYGTLEAVKTAFDSAVSAQSKKEASQSSGSSGGGGGGGGGGSSSISSGFGVWSPQTNTGSSKPPEASAVPLSGENEAEAAPFDDLEGFDWARNDIEQLCGKGIVSGTGSRKFEPAREIMREEFVKMLVLAFDLSVSQTYDFTDVMPEAWYAGYIGAAVKAEFANGQGSAFGIGQAQSRQDVAVMAARALGLKDTAEEINFTDSDEIADYARSAVSALAKEGVLKGYDDGSFRPRGVLTRAEAAVIISRVIERR